MTDQLRLLHWSERDRIALRGFVQDLHKALGGERPHSADMLETLPEPAEPSELERAKAILKQRQARSRAFASVRMLFHDAAWDIMLQLFISQEEGSPLAIDRLRRIVDSPLNTLERWLSAMEHLELVARLPPGDAACGDVVALTPAATEMMLRFLDQV